MFPFFCTPHHLCRAVNPQGEGKSVRCAILVSTDVNASAWPTCQPPIWPIRSTRASHMLGSYTTRQQERRDERCTEAGRQGAGDA